MTVEFHAIDLLIGFATGVAVACWYWHGVFKQINKALEEFGFKLERAE